MPLFLEPDQQFPIVLDCDKDKPAESQPTFLCKSQSMRGMMRLSEFMDADRSRQPFPQIVEDHVTELMSHCVGWRNVPVEFSREAIIDTLNYFELRELLRKIMLNQHVQIEEKKS
jgi:hypothetical protein